MTLILVLPKKKSKLCNTTFFRDNGALFDIDLTLASYVVYQNDLLNEQKQ